MKYISSIIWMEHFHRNFTGELKAFLLVNRDLEDQLQSVENCRLPIPLEHFPDKESLKKDIVHECPDYYAIAAAENTLTENDRKTLKMRKDTAVFQALTQTYRKLKLRPDLSIQFEQKARLYRKNTRQLFFRIQQGLLPDCCFCWVSVSPCCKTGNILPHLSIRLFFFSRKMSISRQCLPLLRPKSPDGKPQPPCTPNNRPSWNR